MNLRVMPVVLEVEEQESELPSAQEALCLELQEHALRRHLKQLGGKVVAVGTGPPEVLCVSLVDGEGPFLGPQECPL